MLIVGDLGGEFDAFQRLIEEWEGRMVLVGDLNDRGPKSRQLIEWAIKNQSTVETLDSNHGDMLVDFYNGIKGYHHGDFLRNGGYHTLVSYGMPVPTDSSIDVRQAVKFARENIPKEHIEFLSTRKVFIEFDDMVVSHAPAPHERYFTEDLSEMVGFSGTMRFNWIWNRHQPVQLASDKWQIFGHNASWGLQVNKVDKWICLDDSHSGKLTGIVWPEQTFVQESFVEPKPRRAPEVEAT